MVHDLFGLVDRGFFLTGPVDGVADELLADLLVLVHEHVGRDRREDLHVGGVDALQDAVVVDPVAVAGCGDVEFDLGEEVAREVSGPRGFEDLEIVVAEVVARSAVAHPLELETRLGEQEQPRRQACEHDGVRVRHA